MGTLCLMRGKVSDSYPRCLDERMVGEVSHVRDWTTQRFLFSLYAIL